MNNEYKIYTIDGIIDIVNEKNVDNFLIDFNNFIKYRVKIRELEKSGLKIKTDDYFNWIDDGKNEGYIKFKVK